MKLEITLPGPDEILAVQYRARQMRAEAFASGLRAVGRGLRGLAHRIASLGARSARA